MNDPDIHAFRTLLEERLRELQDNAQGLREAAQPVELDQSRMGRLSRVDAIQSRELALKVVQVNEEKQERILAALRRLEAGTYGQCLTCKGPIAQERLQFDPAITQCITCAQTRPRR